MHGKTARKFSRREFAVMLFGAGLAGGVRPVLAAVDPAEDYVGKIADEVMSLANSGAKGTALRGRLRDLADEALDPASPTRYTKGPVQPVRIFRS